MISLLYEGDLYRVHVVDGNIERIEMQADNRNVVPEEKLWTDLDPELQEAIINKLLIKLGDKPSVPYNEITNP